MQNFHKYLAITPVEEAWGFYVSTIGYSKTDPNQNYPDNTEHPLTHSFTWNKGRILNGYYLVFISRGRGVFESAGGKPIGIEAGTCFFLFPGVWHRYRPDPESGWEEYWVGFKGSYPDRLMNQGFFSSDFPVVSPGQNDTLLNLFSKILDNVRTGSIGYHQVISGITLQLLGLVHALSHQKEVNADEDIQSVEKAKFYMREHLEGPVDIPELVRELPMSYSKFRKMFKQVTGQTPISTTSPSAWTKPANCSIQPTSMSPKLPTSSASSPFSIFRNYSKRRMVFLPNLTAPARRIPILHYLYRSRSRSFIKQLTAN